MCLQNEIDKKWLDETWEKLQVKLSAECDRIGDKIPYTTDPDGMYHDDKSVSDINWWTNGFWGGILWQMYHATKDEKYRVAANGVEKKLDEALNGYDGLHHDVGFMWLHTAVANYRLTGNPQSRSRGLHAANILAGRYNPEGRFLRAWNMDRTGWIIIDCMMNIQLLFWATEETGDPRFEMVAKNHADTSIEKLLRADGSTNHIAILDPMSGEVLDLPGGQGYESGSSWSRGQAWALYGFALTYARTKEQKYLDAAKRTAHYFIASCSQTGYLPVCDFRSPREPVFYDTTAGACAACGLLEIAAAVGEYEKGLYEQGAMQILKAIDQNCCDYNPQKDSVVGSGAEAYHNINTRNIPIIYGDYFFTEAVLRLKGEGFMIW